MLATSRMKMSGSEEKSEQEHKQQDHMWTFRPTLTWMIYPKLSSLVTLNLTLMTLRYIFRSRQRTLIHVYVKLLRVSDMFQSGVALTTFLTYPEKTKFVLFGVRHLISQLPSNITVPFLGQALVPVTSAKDLGVTLDSNLTFNGYITSLTVSLLSTLVQINRVRHLFSKEVLCIILNSLIFSKLCYCSTVWFGTSKENIHKLQLMQNFASRILTNKKRFFTPVLHELGLLAIEELSMLRWWNYDL